MLPLTAVILNWKRPSNLLKYILPSLMANENINEIIVGSFGEDESIRSWGKVTVVTAGRDLGLDSRFALGLLAKTQLILIQDDDILLPDETIEELARVATAEPMRIHGLFGRNPTEDNRYAQSVCGSTCEVDMVLTRALVTWRRNLSLFFVASDSPVIMAARGYSNVLGCHPQNGEDIILSYAVMFNNGTRHRVYNLPSIELPRLGVCISRDLARHKSVRTNIMRACQRWMGNPD